MKNKRFWIGVASKNHVLKGVDGGFSQLCHGKAAPLKRMSKGDWIVYYSSKEDISDKKPYQFFTAVGEIIDDEIYQFDMGNDFVPFRRNVKFHDCLETDIKPLVPKLSFIEDKKHWGYSFRYGFLEITRADFIIIWKAMKVKYE
ncbi:MAG: EVE domain-containing protein [Sebaldella sp.]|nr:EVE domain-containing protein [Sebaldella sp.]